MKSVEQTYFMTIKFLAVFVSVFNICATTGLGIGVSGAKHATVSEDDTEENTSKPKEPKISQPSQEKGFKEVQASDMNGLRQALEQAKQDGVKHVVVRYGNDETCPHCAQLRDELKQQFGNDSDVRVIKMPSQFKPMAAQGIPQSMLLNQDSEGNWPDKATLRVGSGVGYDYKSEVNGLKQKQNRNPALKYLELDHWQKLKPGDTFKVGEQVITVVKGPISEGLRSSDGTTKSFVIPTSEGWRLIRVDLKGTGGDAKVETTIFKYDPMDRKIIKKP
jgi:hypothetical protein